MLGDLDKSLFVIEGRLMDGISPEVAEKELMVELEHIKQLPASEDELQKVKNKTESSLIFGEISVANKALNLAYFEMLGDAALSNKQAALYNNVSAIDIMDVARKIIIPENCSTLYYLAQNN